MSGAIAGCLCPPKGDDMMMSARAAALILGAIAVGTATAAATEPMDGSPFALRAVRSGFNSGDAIGLARTGTRCTDAQERGWSPLVSDRFATELRAALASERSGAGTAHHAWRPDALLVDAFVNDVRIDLCGAGSTWRGTAAVQITWTVTSPTGQLLYQASTQGSATQPTFTSGKSSEAIQRAVRAATKTFVADKRLQLATANDRAAEIHASR